MATFLLLAATIVSAWFGPVGYYYYTEVAHVVMAYDGLRIVMSFVFLVALSALAASLKTPQSQFDTRR